MLNPQSAVANFIDVDVGANGSVDFHASGVAGDASLPVTIPANGAVVRLDVSTFSMCGMSGPFANDVQLTAEFVPHPGAGAPVRHDRRGLGALPLPPPGTAIYAQGLVFDAGGVPRSTNSIRALWQ